MNQKRLKLVVDVAVILAIIVFCAIVIYAVLKASNYRLHF